MPLYVQSTSYRGTGFLLTEYKTINTLKIFYLWIKKKRDFEKDKRFSLKNDCHVTKSITQQDTVSKRCLWSVYQMIYNKYYEIIHVSSDIPLRDKKRNAHTKTTVVSHLLNCFFVRRLKFIGRTCMCRLDFSVLIFRACYTSGIAALQTFSKHIYLGWKMCPKKESEFSLLSFNRFRLYLLQIITIVAIYVVALETAMTDAVSIIAKAT